MNSETPISRNVFFPMGGVDGMSLAAGALAMLGTGSVALVSVHVFGGASFRQPVTLTISTLAEGCAACSASSRIRVVMGRMIPPCHDGQRGTRGNRRNKTVFCVFRGLCVVRS